MLGHESYNIISSPPWEHMAKSMQANSPSRFAYRPTKWAKFKDSQMDDIELGGFTPVNVIRGSHVLFLASFHNNDAILSQFQAMVALSESFVQSLTVLLPFYPTGTMERVVRRGQVATASTIARMFSSLPSTGRPCRVIILDVHTLQNQFYFHGHALADLYSCIPLLLTRINAYTDFIESEIPVAEMRTENPKYDAIAFPDEGAGKRFKSFFPGFPVIVCGKERIGENRIVTIQDGNPVGMRVLIVDDMIRSGGTITEAAKVIKKAGAKCVAAHCTHAAGELKDLMRFLPNGDRYGVFEKFYLSNSVPTATTKLQQVEGWDTVFEILDIEQLFIDALD